MTRLAPPAVPPAPSRLIRCTRCGQPVEVVELPGPHIDAATYVGVCCLREKP